MKIILKRLTLVASYSPSLPFSLWNFKLGNTPLVANRFFSVVQLRESQANGFNVKPKNSNRVFPLRLTADNSAKSNPNDKSERPRIVSSVGRPIRLDRLLSNRGLGSRTEVAKFLRQGRIRVNGVIMRAAATKVLDTCMITFNEQLVDAIPLLVIFHKPKGIVSTLSDDWGRKHLKDVIPEMYTKHMHPVGRLDADSSGLLLLSSDGTLTHKLLQPKFKVEREYECLVQPGEGIPPPGEMLMEKVQQGIATADGIFPGEVTAIDGNKVKLIVKEGKYRMVRRMLANAGYPVIELHRFRYGDIVMEDSLKEGECIPVLGKPLLWAQWLRKTPESILLASGPNSKLSIRNETKIIELA